MAKTKMAADDSKVEMEEVTLSAKNHFQALNDGLWNLFRASSMVDVTLTCHGKSLKVHRLLLAIFSPILKDAILSASEEDSGENCLSIEKGGEKTFLLSLDYVTAEEASYVQYLVEFLYRGSVTLPKDGLESLLHTARVLAIQGLVDAIEEFIDNEMARVALHSCDAGGARVKGHYSDNEGPSITGRSSEHEASVRSMKPQSNKVMCKRKPIQLVEVVMDDDDMGSFEDSQQPRTAQRSSHRMPKVSGASEISSPEEVITDQRMMSESMPGSSSEHSNMEMSFDVAPESTEDGDIELEKLDADEESVLGLASMKESNAKKRQRRKPLQPKKVVREPEKDKEESRRIFIKEYCKIWRQTRPVIRCHYCNYETQDKGSYKSHIARHDPSAERFQCDICGKSFRSKNGIRGHMRSHGDPDFLHKCTQCDFQTPQKWNWLKHLAVIHKVDPDGNPLQENIKCEQCQFQCVANHQLKAHMLRHHTLDKPFKCTECDYAAVIKHELNKHISISHKKERFYACDICGFRSQTQGGLTRHRRTHTGEKPFKCDLCEMRYADRGKLKVHVLRHAREKKQQYSIIGHS